ncbi:hypothetical protein ACSFBI_05045 [Variovorax sp. RB3P1]|uniref:hypothetical protein n=1 Tax=Variovorax sp. RB3P1 TaxID=3443732 RepID=UPI003F45E105
MAKIKLSTYMPREKELRVEFTDGKVYWYDEVNKRDVDTKIAEAVADHSKKKS